MSMRHMNPKNDYERYERKESEFESIVRYIIIAAITASMIFLMMSSIACSPKMKLENPRLLPYQPNQQVDTLIDRATGEQFYAPKKTAQ